jgi:hypothetical protein
MERIEFQAKMMQPNQAAPVERKPSGGSYASSGVTQSQQCGCPNLCLGACAFGHCQGICV